MQISAAEEPELLIMKLEETKISLENYQQKLEHL